MTLDSITKYKDLVTMVGVVVAVVALVVNAWNARKTFLNNRARFWLDLRTHFTRHEDVHRSLRPGGKWSTEPFVPSDVASPGPESLEEWADVESYMGLFEHCETLFQARMIDAATFASIYRYRLVNLYANQRIRVEKLERNAPGWQRFLDLMDRVGLKRKDGPDRETA